ncbi:hypothetical protein EX30DRAFT_344758 [Ascodesmis nigricans]|uniref:Ribosome biogenesis protein NSA1 n=1 Tax=Ascodesmis nigricans TaxID=341454 RepID=A0A4S2MI63_9PEZI|nr:hypothetical protein EX30DRAFT_344758 [Ascodesmis nigricans]
MKRVWSSKAPKNDERGLERVVLTTGVEFWGAQPVEGSSSSATSSSTTSAPQAAANSVNKPHRHHHRPPTTPPPHLRFLAASTDGCIRIYDTTLSRRAIHTTPISTSPITSFTILPSSSAPSTTLLTPPSTTPLTAALSSPLTIAVSTLSSETHIFSLSSRRLLHSLRGTTGAIQNLCLHHDEATDETLIAGVGNGRYLCVWDQNGKLVVRAFTKTVGTTVAFVEVEDEAEETGGENEEGDQEEEDVWEGMKVVGEGEEGEKKRKGRGREEEDKEERRKKVRG